jgi:hypothetical protein
LLFSTSAPDLLVEVEIGFLEFLTSLLAVMLGAIGASQVSADFIDERQDGRAVAARIFDILDGPGRMVVIILIWKKVVGSLLTAPSKKGAINFDNKSEFRYSTRPNHPVFYKSETGEGLKESIGSSQGILGSRRKIC